MPERIVDVLEVIQVHQQHGDGRRGGRGVDDRLVEQICKQHAVRQASERVAVGEIHDARFAAGDVLLHVFERCRKVADLVATRGCRQFAVITRRDPPRHMRELAQRTGNAARDCNTGDDRNDNRQ